MAKFSFDIVSEVDLQEMDNAINQAKKELAQRYDFKNSKSSIDYDRKENKVVLVADDDYKLKALKSIFVSRVIGRGISPKALTFSTPDKAFEGTLRQKVEISIGISKEKAKELAKIIRDLKLKVQTQIEDDKLRVSSQKKDDLQVVITHLKSIDFSLALSFCNYR